jgi:hypothetical protein
LKLREVTHSNTDGSSLGTKSFLDSRYAHLPQVFLTKARNCLADFGILCVKLCRKVPEPAALVGCMWNTMCNIRIMGLTLHIQLWVAVGNFVTALNDDCCLFVRQ